jgi:magnesium-transporting ATPase (P-type)
MVNISKKNILFYLLTNVNFSRSDQMGLALVDRSLTNLKLRTPAGEVASYTVLQIFPFTSETKRMGIILKEEATGDITFYMKVCFVDQNVAKIARE